MYIILKDNNQNTLGYIEYTTKVTCQMLDDKILEAFKAVFVNSTSSRALPKGTYPKRTNYKISICPSVNDIYSHIKTKPLDKFDIFEFYGIIHSNDFYYSDCNSNTQYFLTRYNIYNENVDYNKINVY